MKELIFTFCVASFSAGLILHIFPDASAKRCMKAVAGLYILASVLNGVQTGKHLITVATHPWQETLCTVELSSNDRTPDFLQQELLIQTKQQLEAQYTAYLKDIGCDAQFEVDFCVENEDVVLQNIRVVSSKVLTPAQQSSLNMYFAPLFAISQVEFVVREEVLS